MAAIPTYVLSPNFTYHPNTSICMGDIVLDPIDPTKPLSSATNLPPIESHIDYDIQLNKQTSRSFEGTIWAKFLQVADAKLSGGLSSNILAKYTIDRLETVYFRKQPTDEEVAERASEPRVRAAMDSGIFGRRPVYMISGLKIARGFRLNSFDGQLAHAEIKGGGQVSADASIGGGGGYTGSDDVQQSYRTGSDIVFAYQLHIIGYKGWRHKTVDVSIYKPKAAFLNEEDEKIGEAMDIETGVADQEGLCAFDPEAVVEVLTCTEGGEPYTCIVFEDE
jgi:hypothetical protein